MSLTARQRLQRHLRTLNQQTNNDQLMNQRRVQQRRIDPRMNSRRGMEELREPMRRRSVLQERDINAPMRNARMNESMMNGPNRNDVLRRIRDVRNNQNDNYDDYYDDYDRYNDGYDNYYDDCNEKAPRQPMSRNQINQNISNKPQRLTLRSMQRESLNRNTKVNTSDQFMDLDSPEYDEPSNGRMQRPVPKNPNNRSTINDRNDDNYDDYDPNDDYNEGDYDYPVHQGTHPNENPRNNPDMNRNTLNGNTLNENAMNESIQPNELSKEIQDRYNELIKELWTNEQKINIYELPQALKEAMNERMKLWLEYFLTNSSFRTSDTNMFEYLDTFTNTTSFI